MDYSMNDVQNTGVSLSNVNCPNITLSSIHLQHIQISTLHYCHLMAPCTARWASTAWWSAPPPGMRPPRPPREPRGISLGLVDIPSVGGDW